MPWLHASAILASRKMSDPDLHLEGTRVVAEWSEYSQSTGNILESPVVDGSGYFEGNHCVRPRGSGWKTFTAFPR
jgi:hypothetical protein